VDHVRAIPATAFGQCPHLGRRVRDADGKIMTRHCGPCGEQDLHVFTCDHPGTPEKTTLLECKACLFSPESVLWRDPARAFDRVVLINLARRPDRIVAFQARRGSHGWKLPEPAVFSAIDGDQVGVPHYFGQGGGAWGCLRSHVAILERAIMDGVNSLLVLEDDVEWFLDSWERLEVFLSRVPADWSQLMLGGQHHHIPAPIEDGVVRVTNCQRTHAYAIRRPAMKSLLRCWYTSAVHLDWTMGNDWQRNWPVYAPEPFIFGQAGGKSDISGRLNHAQYWNAPTNASVVVLNADPFTASELRTRGLHMGFRRDKDDYDEGLAILVAAGLPIDGLRDWLSSLLWEAASIEGRVVCVWHPEVSADTVRKVHAGPVIEVAGANAAECLPALAGLKLKQVFSSNHVCYLRAPRSVVEAAVGFHRGFSLNPETGRDSALEFGAERDQSAAVKKWYRHTREEAERISAIPTIWHTAYAKDTVRHALPKVWVLEVEADSPADIYTKWSEYVS
jgi:GR25 family glycosyltransferase involved in LPS biosynthesis